MQEQSLNKNIGPTFLDKSLKGDCVNSARYVAVLCSRLSHVLKAKISCRQFDTRLYPNLSMDHSFCIITIDDGEDKRSFLVDCTYIQFFDKESLLDKEIGKGMLKKKTRRSTARKLIQQGYVEITPSVESKEHNLSNYCDCITEVIGRLRKKYEKYSSANEDNEQFYKHLLKSDIQEFIKTGTVIDRLSIM